VPGRGKVGCRMAAVLGALRAGARTSRELAALPVFASVRRPSERRVVVRLTLHRLARRGLIVKVGGDKHRTYLPADPPGAVTVTEDVTMKEIQPRSWTLEELLYWLSSCRGLGPDALAEGLPRALGSVRAAVVERDRLRGQSDADKPGAQAKAVGPPAVLGAGAGGGKA
jgi:hypothetical protein